MGNPHPSIPNKQITRQYFPARELSNNKELKTYMITYKRIRGDDKSLALYYTEADFSVRYEIDKDQYRNLPNLTWRTDGNYLITKNTGVSLAVHIATGGQKLGKDKFIHFKDGNILNLRRSNLEIIYRNRYISNGDITQLIISSPLRNVKQPDIVLFDTKYLNYVKKHMWYISQHGYVQSTSQTLLGTKSLHCLIVSIREMLIFDYIVDHINRNKLDNTSINLRQATIRTNCNNRNYVSKKSESIIGIRRRHGAWIARSACPNNPGKQRECTFSIDTFGEDKAKQMAIAKRKEWEIELGITSVIIT